MNCHFCGMAVIYSIIMQEILYILHNKFYIFANKFDIRQRSSSVYLKRSIIYIFANKLYILAIHCLPTFQIRELSVPSLQLQLDVHLKSFVD